MKAPLRHHSQEHRFVTLTVTIATVNGKAIQVTYAVEATVWTGSGGVGGYVSARPREIHLPDGDVELT